MKSIGSMEAVGSALLSLLVVGGLSYIANTYYQPVKPVMSFLTAMTPWAFGEGFAEVQLYGYKDRNECRYIKYSEIGLAIVGGQRVEESADSDIGYEWVDAAKGAGTFPAGFMQPDLSRWTGEAVRTATKLGLGMYHDCGDGVPLYSEYWYSLPEH